MQIEVFSSDGKVIKNLTLPKEIFGVKEDRLLLAQAVNVFLANQRKSRAKVKTRAEVSGSGRKIWRQKGTGRARHGDQYAPIFVGGGVAHGPTGKQNWKLNFPKKKKNLALKVALSQKFKVGQLILVDNFSKIEAKTKQADKVLLEFLKKTAVLKQEVKKQKTLLVFGGEPKEMVLPFRNLPWVKTMRVENLNPYFVLNNQFLVLDQEALNILIRRLSG